MWHTNHFRWRWVPTLFPQLELWNSFNVWLFIKTYYSKDWNSLTFHFKIKNQDKLYILYIISIDNGIFLKIFHRRFSLKATSSFSYEASLPHHKWYFVVTFWRSGSGRSSQTRTVRPIVNLIIHLYFKLPRIWQVIPNMTDKTYSWEVSARSRAVLCHRSHHHSNNHQRLHYHHHHHYRHHCLKGLCHSDLSHFTTLKCVFTLIAMKFVQWRLNNCIDTVCCCPLLRIARMEMDCILKNLASIF